MRNTPLEWMTSGEFWSAPKAGDIDQIISALVFPPNCEVRTELELHEFWVVKIKDIRAYDQEVTNQFLAFDLERTLTIEKRCGLVSSGIIRVKTLQTWLKYCKSWIPLAWWPVTHSVVSQTLLQRTPQLVRENQKFESEQCRSFPCYWERQKHYDSMWITGHGLISHSAWSWLTSIDEFGAHYWLTCPISDPTTCGKYERIFSDHFDYISSLTFDGTVLCLPTLDSTLRIVRGHDG